MAGEMPGLRKTRIGMAICKDIEVEEFSKLLKSNDPFFIDNKGNTYLHLISVIGRPALFHRLIATGIEVNQQNKRGQTALVLGAIHGQPLHVADLIAYGADPSLDTLKLDPAKDKVSSNILWKPNWEKLQPGMWNAVKSNDPQSVKTLIDYWCKVDLNEVEITYKHQVRHVKVLETLRQAASQFPDIMDLIDGYRYTLMLIYAVLENNLPAMKHALDRKPCDVNHLKKGCGKSHILQYALSNKTSYLEMTNLLCTKSIPGSYEEHTIVDPNIYVTINGMLRAPLYFDVFHKNVCEEARKIVHGLDIDVSLTDEFGRCCLIYALDATRGELIIKTTEHFLNKGMDVSLRDQTGSTSRDVAMFYGRSDIVRLIDQLMVGYIRNSQMDTLVHLAVNAYEHFEVTYKGLDSYILACGNEGDEVLKFLEWLPKFQAEVKRLHAACGNGDLKSVRTILESTDKSKELLTALDKGGRNCLHLALMHDQFDIADYILKQESDLVNSTDNVGTTPLDIAHAYKEKRYIDLLKRYSDCIRERSGHYIKIDLEVERKRVFDLSTEVQCLEKYDQLSQIIQRENTTTDDFIDGLRRFKLCPVSKMPIILQPRGHILVKHFEDLLLQAIRHNKEEIAIRLVHLQAFPHHSNDENLNKLKNILTLNLSRQHNMNNLSNILVKKLTKLGYDAETLNQKTEDNGEEISSKVNEDHGSIMEV